MWIMEKGMATHSSILACEIPRTEEPGGLQSMGSQNKIYIYVCVCVYQINTLYTLDLIMLHVDCMSIKLEKNLLELQYNYIEKRRSGKMSVLGSLSCQGE